MIRRAALLVLLLAAAPAAAGDVRVVDGDGLRAGDERVRLWGIDAPELRQDCTRDGERYPCGKVAAVVLEGLIGGDPVACIEVDRDRYGRTVARCEVGGVDLAGLMVTTGWAVDYERYSGGHYAGHMMAARMAGRGLWGGAFSMPWDWRKGN